MRPWPRFTWIFFAFRVCSVQAPRPFRFICRRHCVSFFFALPLHFVTVSLPVCSTRYSLVAFVAEQPRFFVFALRAIDVSFLVRCYAVTFTPHFCAAVWNAASCVVKLPFAMATTHAFAAFMTLVTHSPLTAVVGSISALAAIFVHDVM